MVVSAGMQQMAWIAGPCRYRKLERKLIVDFQNMTAQRRRTQYKPVLAVGLLRVRYVSAPSNLQQALHPKDRRIMNARAYWIEMLNDQRTIETRLFEKTELGELAPRTHVIFRMVQLIRKTRMKDHVMAKLCGRLGPFSSVREAGKTAAQAGRKIGILLYSRERCSEEDAIILPHKSAPR